MALVRRTRITVDEAEVEDGHLAAEERLGAGGEGARGGRGAPGRG